MANKEMTLTELQRQIEDLQLMAQAIIDVEKAGVIEEIKGKIKQYGLTFEELGFKAPEPAVVSSPAVAPAPEKPSKPSKPSTSLIPVYRNKDNDKETWHGGRGAYPKWIYDNIINTVLDKEKGDDGKVAKEKIIKYLDENGYKIEVKEDKNKEEEKPSK